MSLVEVCAGVTCGSLVIEVQYFKTFFMNFKLKQCGTHISCVQNRLFISSECPFHTLHSGLSYFQVYIIIFFFMATKVNSSTKSDFFTSF